MAQSAGAPRRLPAARGEFIIRNGHVLTMEPDIGDFPSGDVHVRDGAIVGRWTVAAAHPGCHVLRLTSERTPRIALVRH